MTIVDLGAELLAWIYGASGVIAALFYVPQILRLVRDKRAREGFSLVTWGAWTGLSVIAFAYASLIVRTSEMMIATGLNMACQMIITVLVTNHRIRRWRMRNV